MSKSLTKHFLTKFLVRWAVSALGLWVASGILGPNHFKLASINNQNGIFVAPGASHTWFVALFAGFLLALVNMAIRPILVVLSFPAVILSLGLFMLVINGFLIMLVHWIYNPLYVKNLGWAILAGIIVGLVNFLVTKVLEDI